MVVFEGVRCKKGKCQGDGAAARTPSRGPPCVRPSIRYRSPPPTTTTTRHPSRHPFFPCFHSHRLTGSLHMLLLLLLLPSRAV